MRLSCGTSINLTARTFCSVKVSGIGLAASWRTVLFDPNTDELAIAAQ
jgi:hypothetical protein